MTCRKLYTTHNDIVSAIYFQEFSDIQSICPLFIKQRMYSDFLVTPILRKNIKELVHYNIAEIILYYWINGDSPLYAASKLKDMRIFDELLLYIRPHNCLAYYFDPIVRNFICRGDFERANILKTLLITYK